MELGPHNVVPGLTALASSVTFLEIQIPWPCPDLFYQVSEDGPETVRSSSLGDS